MKTLDIVIPVGVLLLSACWINFGAIRTASLLAEDFCQAIEQYDEATCDTCAPPASYLQVALPCPSRSEREQLLSAMRGWAAESAEAANAAISGAASPAPPLCVPFCSTYMGCATGPLTRFLELDCHDNALNLSTTTLGGLDAAYGNGSAPAAVLPIAFAGREVIRAIDKATATSSCSFMLEALFEHHVEHCAPRKGLGKALTWLWGGCGLMAVSYLFAVVWWIIGQRRFDDHPPDDLAHAEQEAEMAEMAEGSEESEESEELAVAAAAEESEEPALAEGTEMGSEPAMATGRGAVGRNGAPDGLECECVGDGEGEGEPPAGGGAGGRAGGRAASRARAVPLAAPP